MTINDLTESYKKLKQLSWSNMTELSKQNLAKYEKVRENYIRDVFADQPLIITPNEINCVYENIYVGTVNAAMSPVLLRSLGITKILNMAKDEEYHDYDDVEDIHVTRIGVYDGHLAPVGAFHKAAEVINDAVDKGENILSHCSAGVSRSSTAVITYLMLYKRMSFSDALLELQSKRNCISPHPLLVRTLIRDLGDKFIW